VPAGTTIFSIGKGDVQVMAEWSSLLARWRRWIIVPALAWGGILVMLAFLRSGTPFQPPFLSLGDIGCVLASVAIGVLAYRRKKKDIVSLCVPLFALFIFIFPMEARPGLAMDIIYAATITALVIRLEMNFPE
jgi:hypothetical protein